MDGLLLVNKPAGITSHEVVKKVRNLTGEKKVGHTGTLDPAAQGLLLVCMGRATKLTPFLQELDKTYQGKIIFGITTASFDEEGEVIEEKDASSLTEHEVRAIFCRFQGRVSQTPPMYSAIHWQGERLYNIARKGQKIKISPRPVYIYELKLTQFSPGIHPEASFELRCSKGTYVRSLCHDIGESSGYGAYQAFLWRTRVGPFLLTEARDLKEIEQVVERSELGKLLFSPAKTLPDFPKILVKKEAEKLIKWGRPLYISHIAHLPSNLEKGDRVRFCSEGDELLAVGVALQSGSHFMKDKVGFKYLRVLA
ncbi:tRNA pseudouridine(55) synthase TruB [Candidatus Aerophobetes bacterium]|nr:tRNA pseudouridine(55) synthase TruB [Candidatus Aerophobetes bacterium]